MIIFGTRGVKSERGRGVFYCPHCQARRNYRLLEQRRFGHLFFIPLLPLDAAEPYVECDTCRNAYRTQALDFDPDRLREQVIQDLKLALLRCLCLVAAADGNPMPDEVAVIIRLYADYAADVVTPDQVLYLVATAADGAQALLQELERLSQGWNSETREGLVYACMLVAFSDGQLSEVEFQWIVAFAQAIGMSQVHFKGVLAELSNRISASQ